MSARARRRLPVEDGAASNHHRGDTRQWLLYVYLNHPNHFNEHFPPSGDRPDVNPQGKLSKSVSMARHFRDKSIPISC